MADNNVRYKISLQDKFSKNIKQAGNSVSSFEKKVVNAGKSVVAYFGARAILKIGNSVRKLGAEMEQTEIAFGTFLGSAEKGKKVIAELNEFANVTPFDNEEVIKSGRVLLAAGIPAEKLTDTLKNIGDVAAGSNVPITDLGNIYAKAMNKGKLQAEELNQLAERGIPIIEVLAKEFGVTKQEVFELGSKGKITSDTMKSAFETMTKEGGIFFNLMKKQSESAGGLLSTLEGKLKLVGIELGKRLLPSVKKATKGFIGFADKLIDITRIKFSEELRKTRFELNAEFEVLKKGNLSIDQRKDLIGEINTKYKDYLPNLLTEKSTLEDIETAQKNANTALLKKINIQAKQEILQEAITKAANASKAVVEAQIESEKRQAEARSLQLGEERDLTNQIEQAAFLKAGRAEGRVNRLTKKYNKATKELLDLKDSLGDFSFDDEDAKRNGLQVTTGPSDELKSGIQTIKSAAPKTFNITVGKFVENFSVNSETINEAGPEVREKFVEMWIQMLADAQAVAS